jgi:hypothetical protein
VAQINFRAKQVLEGVSIEFLKKSLHGKAHKKIGNNMYIIRLFELSRSRPNHCENHLVGLQRPECVQLLHRHQDHLAALHAMQLHTVMKLRQRLRQLEQQGAALSNPGVYYFEHRVRCESCLSSHPRQVTP